MILARLVVVGAAQGPGAHGFKSIEPAYYRDYVVKIAVPLAC
jgi:hypothetical protein